MEIVNGVRTLSIILISRTNLKCVLLTFLLTAGLNLSSAQQALQPRWSGDQLDIITSLWIGELASLPDDPSNRYANNSKAAALGKKLFFDTRFSGNSQVACATCHQSGNYFTDSRKLSQGSGQSNRHTPGLLGTAYSPWLFWDGRIDSLWAQPLEPLENPNEHAGNRAQFVHLLATHYRIEYETIFDGLPDSVKLDSLPDHAGPHGPAEIKTNWNEMSEQDRTMVNHAFANIGKSIAAYLRTLIPQASRFDQYVDSLIKGEWSESNKIMTEDEQSGLEIFIGDGNCTHCHNGPLLTNNEFHNIGLPSDFTAEVDSGRIDGVKKAQQNIFNCMGKYSDATLKDCDELNFVKAEGLELVGAFKTPSLRNVAETGPYMHTGQFESLSDVLNHYRLAPFTFNGKTELLPLNLTDSQITQLEDFLKTLTQL